MNDAARQVVVYVLSVVAVGWVVTLAGVPLTDGVVTGQTLATVGLIAGLPVAAALERWGVTVSQLTDFWTAQFVLGIFLALPLGTRIAAAGLPLGQALLAQGLVVGVITAVAVAMAAAGGYHALMDRLPG